MSRSGGVVTVARGTKAKTLQRLAALRLQFGPHGVEVVEHAREARGVWRLAFRLTPDREKIRQINEKLRGVSEPVVTDAQWSILAGMAAGDSLKISRAGRVVYWLGSSRVRAADVAALADARLLRQDGDAYKITVAGRRVALRRLGG